MSTTLTTDQITHAASEQAAWKRVAEAGNRYMETGGIKNARTWAEAQFELARFLGSTTKTARKQKNDILDRCAAERFRPAGSTNKTSLTNEERNAIRNHRHGINGGNEPDDVFNYVAKKRKCNMCGSEFNSSHAGNRRCPPCSDIVKLRGNPDSRMEAMHI